jgi:YHS domain-containing protein
MSSQPKNNLTYFDPVCGLEVDPGKLTYKTSVRGHRYHFCTEKCRDVFNRNPLDFIDVRHLMTHGKKWWSKYLDRT